MTAFSALAFVLGGCATAPAHTGTPNPRVGIATVPSSAPTPLESGETIAVTGCCTATVPNSWSAPELVSSGLEASYDPTGKLAVTWQVVGTANHCPNQPAALVNSLSSPTHPSGNVIIAVDPIAMHGQLVTVYVTAPSNKTEHDYQFLSADAVMGSHCIAVGGAEYGAASARNLATLLAILATTKVAVYPSAPATP